MRRPVLIPIPSRGISSSSNTVPSNRRWSAVLILCFKFSSICAQLEITNVFPSSVRISTPLVNQRSPDSKPRSPRDRGRLSHDCKKFEFGTRNWTNSLVVSNGCCLTNSGSRTAKIELSFNTSKTLVGPYMSNGCFSRRLSRPAILSTSAFVTITAFIGVFRTSPRCCWSGMELPGLKDLLP